MSEPRSVALGDQRFFSFVPGLWSGEKPPLVKAAVLRSTNFRGDGLFDFEDVAVLDVEARHLAGRRLQRGDIVIERSGGGPKQPVGRVAYFAPPDDRQYATSNFTTALRVVDPKSFDPEYVCLFLHALYQAGATEPLQRATTGIRNLDWSAYRLFEIPLLGIHDQRSIARLLTTAREGVLLEEAQRDSLVKLKRSAMQALFTRGLRGEAQKDTKIGPVPQSWDVARLDYYATVVSTRMSYADLQESEDGDAIEMVRVLGVKVSDMNLPGNETALIYAQLDKRVPSALAQRCCAPPGTVIFPKRGAAIATNKKRIANEWLVFDPNIIGVIAGKKLEKDFLFQWFQSFDLRAITEPGPTPQLNKKNLEPLLIAVPPREEQCEIAEVLEAIDRKIDLHRRKRVVLEDLFKALLHKLMTGEIRVSDLDLSALAPEATAGAAA